MRRRVGLAVGSLGAVLAVVLVGVVPPGSAQDPTPPPPTDMARYQAPVDVDTAGLPGPVQPIFYRHDVHAGEYQMDCRYCHFAVEISPNPGLPTVSTCMGCHIIAGAAHPEVQKLREYWNERRPIEWVEVHRMAPFVRFPHHRHIRSVQGSFADLSPSEKCEVCHGPIQEMPQVYQYASLTMGWCITCHEAEDVTTDCTACHY